MRIDVDQYRRLLLARRESLVASFKSLDTALPEAGAIKDEDWAPFAHDRFVSVRVKRLDFETLQLIDLALLRLGSGEFGKCLDCGKPIAAKRLNVVPWASRCVACQEHLAVQQNDAGQALQPEGIPYPPRVENKSTKWPKTYSRR